MDAQLFESLLKKHHTSASDPQAHWDACAAEFGKRVAAHPNDHAKKTVGLLLDKQLLRGARVLDVGAGTGRYAVPFAEYAVMVTAADVSSQMLAIAETNAGTAGRENLRYKTENWETADLKALGWEKSFDLVFSSMCPAVMSKAGIDRMTAASRGWCLINQIIEMTDDISRMLIKELGVKKSYDPHNDRDAVQGIFNLLWLQGFLPEIIYLKDARIRGSPAADALAGYAQRFGKAAAQKGAQLTQLLADYTQGDKIIVNSRTTVAMILWKA